MNTAHHMISIPYETDEAIGQSVVATKSVSELATEAVRAAFQKTRDAGLSVVVAEGDELVELSPDGSRTVLKQLPPLRKPSRRTIIFQ